MPIILISEKTILKKAEKLVEYQDYILIDGTDKEDTKLSKFQNVANMPGFNPPAKCLKESSVLDGESKKVEEALKKYLKSKEFVKSVLASTKGLIENDGAINVFIVLKEKAYKKYAKTIKKRIHKLFDTEKEFAFTFKDVEDDKKIIKKPTKGIEAIKKAHKRLEKKLIK